MCGICGALTPPGRWSREELEHRVRALAEPLAHRGPDGEGIWHDHPAGVALGHRRLAILDLSPRARQPMVSHCGRWVLTYNGEIYNFRQLGRDLESSGTIFRGSGDTEVLLAALAHWGVEDALARCNGMFAFGLWDRQLRRLHLVRDRLGQKPLYWALRGETLLFASQPRALWTWPGFAPQLDRRVLPAFFRRGVAPAPHSLLEDVFQLPPGHRLVVEQGREGPRPGEPAPYWSVAEAFERGAEEPFDGSAREAEEVLEELLRDAVVTSTVSDVPVGTFLSGGIDSSLVTALLAESSARPPRTFSIGFSDSAFDETPWATRVAERLGTEHSRWVLGEEDALALVPELPGIWDEPFADSSQIPTALLARQVRDHVTVALTGDGGDEIFGGYAHYRGLRRLDPLWKFPPSLVRWTGRAVARGAGLLPGARTGTAGGRNLEHLGPAQKLQRLGRFLAKSPSADDAILRLRSIWKDPATLVPGAEEPATWLTTPASWPRVTDPVRRVMALDAATYLPDDILVKVDRAAMAVGLESRIPLLDHRVVELAARLPLSHLEIPRGGKAVLRRLLARRLPAEWFTRRKQGFQIPVDRWLRGKLRPWAEELLARPRLEEAGLDPSPIRRLWRQHLDEREAWGAYLWPVLMIQSWRRHWRGRRGTGE